jgi:hypothetical protein
MLNFCAGAAELCADASETGASFLNSTEKTIDCRYRRAPPDIEHLLADLLSLPEIKSGRIDSANLRDVGQTVDATEGVIAQN